MSPILVDNPKIDFTSKHVIGLYIIGYTLDVAEFARTSQKQMQTVFTCLACFSLFEPGSSG